MGYNDLFYKPYYFNNVNFYYFLDVLRFCSYFFIDLVLFQLRNQWTIIAKYCVIARWYERGEIICLLRYITYKHTYINNMLSFMILDSYKPINKMELTKCCIFLYEQPYGLKFLSKYVTSLVYFRSSVYYKAMGAYFVLVICTASLIFRISAWVKT